MAVAFVADLTATSDTDDLSDEQVSELERDLQTVANRTWDRLDTHRADVPLAAPVCEVYLAAAREIGMLRAM